VSTIGEVRTERIGAAFQQIPTAALVTIVNACLMAAVLQGTELRRDILPWLAAAVLVSLGRLGAWSAYLRAKEQVGRGPLWGVLIIGGAAAAGLLWGLGSVLLLPESEALQLLWVFVIGGMCAGTVALNYAYLPAVLAFILPAALPLATDFALQGSTPHRAAAAMIGVFLAALVVTSRRSSGYFGEMVRLRLNLAERTRELDVANRKLKEEMAEHAATEASLRHAQKMEALGQLTGGIAHDFSNLLMAVQSSLDMLRRRVPQDDKEVARLLDTAALGTERGVALTKRLLAFGRHQPAKVQVLDVSALVRSMSALLHSSLGAGVQVKLRFPDALAPVEVDANQFELALLNLAVNARDAMPNGGEITIGGREEEISNSSANRIPAGHYVVVQVEDNGEGMDEPTLARATEPFFTTKDIGKGTGLGLSMVRSFATEAGGCFVLHSRKHCGTVAELWLPQARTAAQPPAREAEGAPAKSGGARTVLVVDDDPLILSNTASMLDDLGYATLEARTGEEALTLLRSNAHVDLVITDHEMPGMTGQELAETVHLVRPQLPVLLASGYPDLDRRSAACREYLQKPFRQQTLARAVERCLQSTSGPFRGKIKASGVRIP
jgi:signal transduction histidine kinase/ActR/RegA family two-component response regulator